MSYNLIQYGSMISDAWRMNPYISALKSKINSRSIVLDLGAGTGIFAMLACKFGAKKVYAIESNPSIKYSCANC